MVESSFSHSLQDLGEAGEERNRSEVREGGGARDFGDRDHDSLLPLGWKEGGVEGVGADEKEVIEECVWGDFVDEVGERIFARGGPFL